MSNSAYLETSTGKVNLNDVSETLVVASSIAYIRVVKYDNPNIKEVSEIHFINGDILYCQQPLKFLNSILFRRDEIQPKHPMLRKEVLNG